MVPTVFLIGVDELERIPEFLELGAIVVVSPDITTLRYWQREQELGLPTAEPSSNGASGVVVEMDAHRISYRGVPIALSEREFRVLAALANGAERALSYNEVRRRGWGDDLQLPIDICGMRSLMQRLRAKLRAVEAPLNVVAVRGYGFRLQPSSAAGARSGPRASDPARPRSPRNTLTA